MYKLGRFMLIICVCFGLMSGCTFMDQTKQNSENNIFEALNKKTLVFSKKDTSYPDSKANNSTNIPDNCFSTGDSNGVFDNHNANIYYAHDERTAEWQLQSEVNQNPADNIIYLNTTASVPYTDRIEGSIILKNGVLSTNQYTTKFVVKKYENVTPGKYKAHGFPQNNNCLYVVIGSKQDVLEYQKVNNSITDSTRDYDFYILQEGCTVYVGGYNSIEPNLYQYAKKPSINDGNPLYNKVVTLNGDSIAYGAGCSINHKNWGFMDFVAKNNGMTLDKQAVSGGCLSVKNSESAGRHYICRTIDNMEQNADYVIFEGGYNDYYLWHKVGSITETMTDEVDDTTVYGALESICRQALEKWKTAKIGFIITHKVNVAWRTVHANSSTERVTLEDYYQAIRDVCEKYSIPYLDLSKVSRLNTELESYKTFTYNSDGIHPTQTGYETFYVPLIENWMKNL